MACGECFGSKVPIFASRSRTKHSTDYFVFGKKKSRYEGILLCIQPWTYFIQVRRIVSRSARAFKNAFEDMERVFSRRFGDVTYLLGDQDTAYEAAFQTFLDSLKIGRFHDATAFKISQVER